MRCSITMLADECFLLVLVGVLKHSQSTTVMAGGDSS